MGGYLMQLQNFSVNDGDGIRTIVFMAGCPLWCAWCANPEGQTCCNAMTHWAETADVLAKIRQQEIFYRYSGGGVTFSGGEATAQPQFLAELVDALYDDGISLALETCGQFDFAALRPVLQKMDLLFMDLKHTSSTRTRRPTVALRGRAMKRFWKICKKPPPSACRSSCVFQPSSASMRMMARWKRRSLLSAAIAPAQSWNCCRTTATARANTPNWACPDHRRTLPHRPKRSLPAGKHWPHSSTGSRSFPTNKAVR